MEVSTGKSINVLGQDVPYYERNLPVESLGLFTDFPSFKSEADPDTGVVTDMRLGGSFEQFGTGPIVAWERFDGTYQVISGRHRDDLAKRTDGVKAVSCHVVREEDGFTAEMARFVDADLNIRDGQGTIYDTAYFFNNCPLSDEQLRERGYLARPQVEDAWFLGRKAIEDLYAMFRDGVVKPAQAVAVVRAVPENPELQRAGIRYIDRNNPSPEDIANYLRVCQAIIGSHPRPETLDLFGADDAILKDVEAMTRIARQRVNGLREKLKTLRYIKKHPEFAEEIVPVVENPNELRRSLNSVEDELHDWDTWALNSERLEELRREMYPADATVEDQEKEASVEDCFENQGEAAVGSGGNDPVLVEKPRQRIAIPKLSLPKIDINKYS